MALEILSGIGDVSAPLAGLSRMESSGTGGKGRTRDQEAL
jgi:hypothetical protein